MAFSTGKKSKTINEINMTPFVDIMLVLLIVFIVSAPMMYSSFEAKLPSATLQNSKIQNSTKIELMADGGIFIGKINSAAKPVKVLPERFAAELSAFTESAFEETIYIAADKNCKYSSVISLIETLNKLGYSNISFVTEN